MKVYTLTCPDCGTVVAANELESNRVQKCPGLDCENVLRFEDLPEEAQEHVLSHAEKYDI
ncbi:hypothetical protein [Haloarchaeobius baliensis]|uniref:hypothetical protein n=1 Tax=Haloarchaeobius baliensis TaxID=1670458 RepID=UPI003F885870